MPTNLDTGELIPQSGKMRFTDTLISSVGFHAIGTSVIRKDNIFLKDDHTLSNSVLIEYVNQLTAAVNGYREKFESAPLKKGFYVGSQDVEFYLPVHLNDTIILEGDETEKVANVTFVEARILRDKDLVATLTTKIYEITDMAVFDAMTNSDNIPSADNADLTSLKEGEKSYCSSVMRRKMSSYISGLNIGDNEVNFSVSFPPDFEAFDGHFPGNPVLPGISQLELGVLAMELYLKKPVILKRLKKLKISGTLFPGQKANCQLKIKKAENGSYSFSAKLWEEGKKLFSQYSGDCIEG